MLRNIFALSMLTACGSHVILPSDQDPPPPFEAEDSSTSVEADATASDDAAEDVSPSQDATIDVGVADAGCIADASATCAGQCGLVLDACQKIVDCGGCKFPDTCNQNKCSCISNSKQTTCAGKCGFVLDNCNVQVDCGNPCVLPQTCGGGGQKNVCGCTDNGKACAQGQICGTAVNNCGKTVACGNGCSVLTPKCCVDKCVCANCLCQ